MWKTSVKISYSEKLWNYAFQTKPPKCMHILPQKQRSGLWKGWSSMFGVLSLYLTQNAFFKKPKLRLDIRISFPSSNALTKIVWNLFGAIKAEITLKYSYFRE